MKQKWNVRNKDRVSIFVHYGMLKTQSLIDRLCGGTAGKCNLKAARIIFSNQRLIAEALRK